MESDKEYMEVAVGGSTIAFSEEDEEGKPGQGQGGGRSKQKRVPQPDNLFDWAEA
jgi:hypothetical protein